MTTQAERGLIVVLASLAATGAAVSGNHPSANRVSDVVLTSSLAAVLTLVCSRARPWAWIALAGAVAVFGSGALQLAGVALEVGAVVSAWRWPAGHRVIGSAIGAGGAQLVLRLGDGPFLGSTAVVAALSTCVVALSAYRAASPAVRRRARRGALVASLLAVLFVVAAGIGLLRARSSTNDAIAYARAGLRAARAGDTAGAARELSAAARSFGDARHDTAAWWAQPVRLLPVLGQQFAGVEQLTRTGEAGASAAAQATTDADVNGLRLRNGRIDLAKVRAAAEPLSEVLVALRTVDDGIRRARSPWLVAPLADRVDAVAEQVNDARADAELASDVIRLAPGLLGGDGSRRYVVLFGNPAEARDLGGFAGGYGELVVDQGRLDLIRTGRASDLNEGGPHALTDPERLPQRFRASSLERFWQNVTGSPDFPTVAEAVRQLWPQSGGAPIDGVLYLDPAALAALLRIAGPIDVPGVPQRLDANNLAAFLTREQYVEFGVEDERHDVLSDAARLVFDRLTSMDLPGPRQIADALATPVDASRLLLHSFHPDEQQLFHQLDVDGALPPPDGDVLVVTSSNRGANKIDTFLSRQIDYDATVDPATGGVTATVRIVVTNAAPPTGLPAYLIGGTPGLPEGTASDVLTVTSGLALERAMVDGAPALVAPQQEYGLHSYGVPVVIGSGGTTTVELHLVGAVSPGGYRVTFVPRSNVSTDQLSVRISPTEGWKATQSDQVDPDGAFRMGRAALLSTERVAVQFAQY